MATEIFEGERRFPVWCACRSVFRNNIEAISNILITSNGAQARLADVAKSPWSMARPRFRARLGKRRIVVGVNVRIATWQLHVAELQRRSGPDQVARWLLPGMGGQFQNMERRSAT